MQQTGDGGYIIAGVTHRISSSVAGSGDLWLIRTDKNGTKYGTESWEVGSLLGRSEQNSRRRLIVTGLLDDSDLWLIKMDETDTRLEKTFAGAGRAEGYAVQQIPEGGYVIGRGNRSPSGNLNEDLWLIKTDQNGKNSGIRPTEDRIGIGVSCQRQTTEDSSSPASPTPRERQW